jgi:Ca2+-binding RTX toxin-like protein
MTGRGQGRRLGVGLVCVLASGAALAAPSQAGAATVDVFLSGGKLNIHAQSGTPLSMQVSYLAGPDDWDIIGNFATAGSGCTQASSAEVTCDENGEDVDVDFANVGSSVSFNVADSFLDFDTDILLGNGTENVTGTDGIDIVHASDVSPTNVNGDTIDTLDGNDQITDGGGSDIISGGDDADTIVANGGNNILTGGEFAGDSTDGADTITGGSIQDDIDGGAGGDTLNGGGDDDEITGGDDGDTINAGPGDDGASVHVVDGEDGDDTVNGEDGNDTLDGGNNNDTLNGGNNNDTLNGDAGTDTLNGAAGVDTLLNSDGSDAFNGGTSGSDADEVDYSVSSGSSSITADADGAAGDDGRNCPGGSCEADSVGSDIENLTGDGGADTLVGNALNNTLDGAGGNDTLAGGAGTGADGGDRFNDTSGTDTVTYNPSTGSARTGALTIDIDGTADDGAGGEGDDLETNIENVIGGSGADTITGSSGSNNDLRGGPGTANDTLNGNGADDTLFGGVGTNTGPDGADVFNGDTNGAAGDTVSYAGRTDAITADLDGVADDGATGENDDINTTVENLTGGSGADTLTGNAGNNALDGGSNNDILRGGTTGTGDGNDVLNGGTGTSDTANYGARTDNLDVDIDGVADDGAGAETDNVTGTTENVTGGSGADDLEGNGVANRLDGGAGDDQLQGGPGPSGPDGADTFAGGSGGETAGDQLNYLQRDDGIFAQIGTSQNGAGGCPSGGGCEDDVIGSDIERMTGTDGNDTLIGSTANNRLSGRQGDDLLEGGPGGSAPDGNDDLDGGSGGETNGDTVSYGARTDNITAILDTTTGNGGSGESDDLDAGVENLTGGSGNDNLTGDALDNVISGGAGNDTEAGGPGGGAPDGADRFNAGPSAGNDTVTYASRTDDIDADLDGAADDGAGNGSEADSVSSTIDNLTGGSGDDDFTGDTKPNVFDGGAGDDDVVPSLATGPDGADTFIGGTNGTAGGQNVARGDRIFMSTRLDSLHYDLGGGANDSDGDDAHSDVEDLTGGEGAWGTTRSRAGPAQARTAPTPSPAGPTRTRSTTRPARTI